MACDLRSATILLALAAGLGCASARVESVQRDTPDAEVVQPSVLLVHDFAVSPAEAIEDVYGSDYRTQNRASTPQDMKAREVAASLSRQLVDRLNKRGINARWSRDGDPPPVNALIVRGHFVTVDPGSRVKRMVIGFGTGATELRARVHAYQATEWGLRRIVQADTSAEGNRMPGVAVPVGAGAIAGQALRAAVISGGMNIVQEVTGGLDADAGRMAEQIARRIEAFYQRQGWL